MRIVGNQDVWKRLVTRSPQAALLMGPCGVGRRTCASQIASQLSGGHELLLTSLLVEDAEKLSSWASTLAPRKVAVISPARASSAGWNRLLKLLESLPPNVFVWIVDEGNTPNTIRTRCVPFVFDLLTTEEVVGILVRDGAATPEQATFIARMNPRTVSQAVRLREASEKQSSVAAWLTAVDNGSREEILSAVSGWNLDSSFLLCKELEEQYEGRSWAGIPLGRVPGRTILRALTILEMDGPPSTAALVAGLNLIEST